MSRLPFGCILPAVARSAALLQTTGSEMRAAGVVLAAGASRRMGSPKALLRLGGSSFLARAVEALRGGGCEPVVVVVGAAAVAAAARRLGVTVVESAAPDAEQIDSLRAALRAMPAAAGAAVVTPVDVPLVTAAVVAALVGRWRRTAAPIVLPAYGGRHGHPTLFARGVWPELLGGVLPEGARSVVQAHAAAAETVPVDEAGVLDDVDTPDDYRRLAGGAA